MPHPALAALAIPAALLLPAAIGAPTEAAGAAMAHPSHHWQHCHTHARPCDKPNPAPKPPAITAAAKRAKVLRAARSALGKPYRYGAAGPSSFDCSGLVDYVYLAAGKRLPRTVAGLARAGHRTNHPAPGDVLLYGTTHAAVVAAVKGNRVISTIVARHTGTVVAYQAPYAAYQVRSYLA